MFSNVLEYFTCPAFTPLQALAMFFSRDDNQSCAVIYFRSWCSKYWTWVVHADPVFPNALPDGTDNMLSFWPLKQLGQQTFKGLFLLSLKMRARTSEFLFLCFNHENVLYPTTNDDKNMNSRCFYCISGFIYCFYLCNLSLIQTIS